MKILQWSIFSALLSFAAWGCSSENPAKPDDGDLGKTSSSSAVSAVSSSSAAVKPGSSSAKAGESSSSVSKPEDPLSSSSGYTYYSSGYFCWSEPCDVPGSSAAVSSSSAKTSSSSSSSSSVKASSSSSAPKSSSSFTQQPPILSGDILTDTRDGMQYMTHLIGSVRWMTQGLCFAVSGSTYYGDNEMHCSDGYGRLYTYAAAAGACPAGWRLPSRAEVEDALDNGLEAIYTGRGSGSDDNFIDQMGFMWTSAAPASGDNDNCSTADCGVILIQNNPDYKIEPPFFQIDSYSKRFGVRCVQ